MDISPEQNLERGVLVLEIMWRLQSNSQVINSLDIDMVVKKKWGGGME